MKNLYILIFLSISIAGYSQVEGYTQISDSLYVDSVGAKWIIFKDPIKLSDSTYFPLIFMVPDSIYRKEYSRNEEYSNGYFPSPKGGTDSLICVISSSIKLDEVLLPRTLFVQVRINELGIAENAVLVKGTGITAFDEKIISIIGDYPFIPAYERYGKERRSIPTVIVLPIRLEKMNNCSKDSKK
ncbi:hypothetical protein [Ekhidna sp.]|uniref:hypothetical protein n=1 Tax=Ekhidna sp. TaxID=2608089 RepID=UPI00329A46F6